MGIVIASLFGLVIGSFLSVCIYRIPAARDDLHELGVPGEEPKEEKDLPPKFYGGKAVKGPNDPPRSLCIHCGEQLLWYHNIPLISWLMLRGRCTYCKVRIPFRYPLVEILSATAAVLSLTTYGATPTALLVYIFCCTLIVLSFIDYDYYILPNVITIPGFFVGCGIAVLNEFTGIFNYPVVPGVRAAFWGLICGGGFLWAFSELFYLVRKKEGLGMGDVKLLAMTGVLFGPQGSLFTIFCGSVVGSILGIVLLLFAGRGWAKPLPFGPYLALGTVCYLFWGVEIGRWWLGTMGAGVSLP